MKKTWFVILLCVLLAVFVGCGAEEAVPPAPETPVETPTQAPEEVMPPVEELPEEVPSEEEAPVEAEPEVPETGSSDVVGIWSSMKGRISDAVLEYQNYYVCLFENGTALRFGWRLLDLGTWTETDDTVTAVFDLIFSLGQGTGWEKCDATDQVCLSYDAESETLVQLSATLDGDFADVKEYFPANRTDSFEGAVTRIGYVENVQTLNSSLNKEEEDYSDLIARLYKGLEQLVFDHVLTTVSEEEAARLEQEEQTWWEETPLPETMAAKIRLDELVLLCGPNQNKNPFYDLPESFVFAYGSNDGWYTELSISMDGSFRGQHVNTNETQTFSGKFKVVEWITRTICKLEVETLKAEQEVYGMDNAEEFLLYLPGTPVAEMSEDFLIWNWEYHVEELETMPSGWYGLFNVGGKEGYLGRRTIDLTDGYWYLFSPQTADCTEYQFKQNGTVIVRQRDVMGLTGEYQDVLHPDMEIYEPQKMGYRVVGGQVYLGDTVYQIDYETGRLVTEYSENGQVYPVYLEQYTGMPATLEEMILGGSRFLQWYNANIRREE